MRRGLASIVIAIAPAAVAPAAIAPAVIAPAVIALITAAAVLTPSGAAAQPAAPPSQPADAAPPAQPSDAAAQPAAPPAQPSDAAPPPQPASAAAEPAAPPPQPAPGAAADPATRPPQPASWRLVLSDLTVLRLNPLGLETRARFGLQKRLYASTKKATENNFAFGGAFVKLNPASAHFGLGGEVQPLSMFNLRAVAEVQQYFGTFGLLQSFPSVTANYSDATLDDLADTSRAAGLFHVALQPTLQLRAGPIALRAVLQLDYWDMSLRDGDVAAYEATLDTLLPDRGFTLATDVDLLYVGRPGLAIGVRHSYVRPLYRRAHFASDAEEAAYDGDNAHQRIGLFSAYTLRDAGPSTFNKPTLILIAAWYLSHRWRTGAPDALPTGGRADDYTSRAFPYLLAGFAFESDFLAARY